ncbi:Ig-like domain repeat protein [Actinocrinis puniceicyclus]|uniref:Ig-like domain repeat protein n=1 Tax=Actinocrinis puniceicyclus TaxID=977794 RepID=A0A8J7WNY4_9ACTN|nr:Ig-like domain-containing protein [Actinocrinis puniceicyclus]MBS2964220.1 Ig-like domain repeat protein [Actinocrinis puniceicyclus]
MSRAFTRALVLSTIGGLGVAPSLAYAAGGGGSSPHAPTVTRVLAPKHAQSGADFLLSARVSLAKGPTAPTTDPQPEGKAAKSGKGKGGRGHGKKGKGGKGHRRTSETGSVVFTVDGKKLAPVRISHGRALEKLTLTPGEHTASATYSGDQHYSPSESSPVTFAVS